MILVTGAAGLVGGAVTRRLVAAGSSVVATDAREPVDPLPCPFVAADIRQPDAVGRLLQDHGVRQVVHSGAISGGMVAPNDPLLVMTVNVTGTIHVAEACRLAGVERLVGLSSIGVYGDQIGTAPVPEDAPKNGTDVYSCSKIAMESVLLAYRQNFGLPVTILRLSSTFGPGRTTPCFIRGLLDAALEGRKVMVSDDTAYRRQFIYIDDAAEAVCLALAAPASGEFVYNISAGVWLTEGEVVRIAKEVVPALQAEIGAVRPLGLDGLMGPLDITRAQNNLGYRPTTSLAAGIRDFATCLGVP